jgi:hypothetical protein
MSKRDQRLVLVPLFEELSKEDASQDAIDEFRNILIIAYERVLEEGINPICAITAVLEWASAEFERCKDFD